MAYPREMTIATGTTVYAGDPGSEERVISREVRVSVTYEIDDDETDVPLLAAVKAAEVEKAHRAARRRVGAPCRPSGPAEEERSHSNETPFDPADPGLEPPDDSEPPDEDNHGPDPFPEEADYLSDSCGPATNSGHRESSKGARNGGAAKAAPVAYQVPVSNQAPVTDQVPGAYRATEAETDWATRPQVLAIKSHFTRLGLSHENQTALLRARFGKFRPERLTKDEAGGLMRFLERGEWGLQGEWEPAIAGPAAR